MAFNFPDSPAVNDEYTAHGVTYRWDGNVWEALGGGTYVAKAGDTMTGGLWIRCPDNYPGIDGTNGWAGISFFNRGVNRWTIQGADDNTDVLEISGTDNAGNYTIGPSLWIERLTRKITFEGPVVAKAHPFTANGDIHIVREGPTIVFDNTTTNTNSGFFFRHAGASAWWIDSASVTHDFRFYGADNAGVFPSIPLLRLERLTGHAIFARNVDIGANVAGNVTGNQYRINNKAAISREAYASGHVYTVMWDGMWDGVSSGNDYGSVWVGAGTGPTPDAANYYLNTRHDFGDTSGSDVWVVIDATKLHISINTPSTSAATGALVVDGGAGIGGNLNVGGTIGVPVISASNYHLDGTIFAKREGAYTRIYDSNGVSVGAFGNSTEPANYWRNTAHSFLPRAGGASWVTIDASGLDITPTTPSTSPITGALRVAGGVGIAGALWLGGAFNFTGAGHIVHQSPGAGFWYDSITAANRFFLGTDAAADTFRLFSAPAGNNVFIIDAATMATTFNAKISTPIGADNQLGDVTAARSPDIGVVHFGSAKSRFLYFDGTNFTLAGGNLTVAGSKVTATHFDAATATLGYQLGGVAAFFRSGNYHVLQSQDGGGNLILGQAAEPSNYYTNTNHYFRDRANTIVMSLIGGALTLQHAVPEVVIAKSASGQAARIYGRTGGSNRWHITLGNQGVESGGDAGSDFVIARYLDSGASTTAMSIQRSNGAVIIPGTLTVQSAGSFQTLSTTGAVNFPGIVNLASVGAIGQNSTGNIQITSPTGHHAFITFHIGGQFATHFGLAADGNFYMGGWSHPSISYRFWTTRDFASVPAIGSFVSNGRLAYAGDFVHYYYVGFGEPFGGAVVTGMSPTDGAGNTTARYRYLQLYTTSWFTVGYA